MDFAKGVSPLRGARRPRNSRASRDPVHERAPMCRARRAERRRQAFQGDTVDSLARCSRSQLEIDVGVNSPRRTHRRSSRSFRRACPSRTDQVDIVVACRRYLLRPTRVSSDGRATRVPTPQYLLHRLRLADLVDAPRVRRVPRLAVIFVHVLRILRALGVRNAEIPCAVSTLRKDLRKRFKC